MAGQRPARVSDSGSSSHPEARGPIPSLAAAVPGQPQSKCARSPAPPQIRHCGETSLNFARTSGVQAPPLIS
eukprot:8841499-Alexandrium_andersonii.AAC.1